MPILRLETVIEAPIERVFDLSRSIDIHVDSMSGHGEKAVDGVTTGLIGLGESVTWRAKHFGIWQRLTSRISAMERPTYFQDVLVDGAFRRFAHDHVFVARGDANTLMIDIFDYTTPLWILGWAADRIFLARYMRRLLAERNETIKSAAESDAWKRFLRPT